jgi:hypothetical protein
MNLEGKDCKGGKGPQVVLDAGSPNRLVALGVGPSFSGIVSVIII